ncbi:MAG: alternative oxidase [Bordetella sp.]|nr:alternative oxidase [Bordetella sp.]
MTSPDPEGAGLGPQARPADRHAPLTFSDRLASAAVKGLRACAGGVFARRYGHRAVVLETIAAVPAMVAATLTHLRALRTTADDHGRVRALLKEAENERMHLMTFVELHRPGLIERLAIMAAQAGAYLVFSLLYLVSAPTAHRLAAYLEEESVASYTQYLAEIDEGRSPNPEAPRIARDYWGLPEDATLWDVIFMVRADEAAHRDVNHAIADELARAQARRPVPAKPHWTAS